jgi:hypothetical protein
VLISDAAVGQSLTTRAPRLMARRPVRHVHPLGTLLHSAGEWNGQQVPGIGEWMMNRATVPVRDYEQLAKQINPVKFDPEALGPGGEICRAEVRGDHGETP